MIVTLLLALTAVTVHSQQADHNGFRKLRQLDLGPQDVNNFKNKEQKIGQVPTTLEAVNNGYLPPVSNSPLPKQIIGAQSQQTFDFSSTNTVENELCKPPFDTIFCNSKKSLEKTESGIPKPSRDLAPPFDDLNQSTNLKTETKNVNDEVTTKKSFEDISVHDASGHGTFTSTTRQTTINLNRLLEPVERITQKNDITKSVPPSEALNPSKAEATNELRSYIPPQAEYSGAAQTSVGVVRPPDQKGNDHDHHHHHGHHHGNICEDAFHSFLCAPLKARKRITGALPSNLRGQSSFVQYQKVLPNSDKETAPSNTFQNEYLPPKLAPSSSSVITSSKPIYSAPQTPKRIVTSTTTTPRTYTSPKVISQPSNTNDRIYSPSLATNRISAPFEPNIPNQKGKLEFSTSTKQTQSTFTIPGYSKSSSVFSPVSISAATKKPEVAPSSQTIISSSAIIPKEFPSSTVNSDIPKVSILNSQSLNTNHFFVTPGSNPSPDASFVSTLTNVRPTVTTSSSLPTVSTFVPLLSNTIHLTSLPKLQPVSTTTNKPFSTLNFDTQPLIPVSFVSSTLQPSTLAPQLSNSGVSYLQPQQKLQSASNVIPTTIKPSITTAKPSVAQFLPINPKFIEQSSFEDRSYLPPPPQQKLQSASNVIPTTLKPSTTTARPTTRKSAPINPQLIEQPSFVDRSPPQQKLHSSSNVIPTTLKSFITTARPTTGKSAPTSPKLIEQASFVDRSYLPPQQKLQSASNVIPTTIKPFVTSTRPAITRPVPINPQLIEQPSSVDRSYLPPQQKLKSASTIIPSTFKTFITTTRPTTRKPVPVSSKLIEQPSSVDRSYLPPQQKLQSASNVIPTTIKPFITTTRPTTRKTASTSPKLIEQPSSVDGSYLPPDSNVQPAAAQINSAAVAPPQIKNPFHHGRDLCTDPFHSFLCVSSKPRKRITGALPSGFRPDSSNALESIVNPAPTFQSEKRIKIETPLETRQSQSVGYSYPRPTNPFPSTANTIVSTTVIPTTGYSYPKPDKIFPSPSQQKEVIQSTTIRKPEPNVLRASEARVSSGYEYPKPEQKFPLPTEQETTGIPSTTKSPSTGYSYPKPQKPFPLPTEQKEVRYSSSKTSVPSNQGYSYPKPQQSFDLPEKKGYFYPKPEKRLEYPTESKPKSLPSKVDLLGDLGSAEFIPVNKLDKREQPSNFQPRKFGERLKKREKTLFN